MSKTKAQLSFKVEKQAKEISKLHKRIREDKKNQQSTQERIDHITRKRDLWIKDIRGATIKLGEKQEVIIGLQRSLLRVNDKLEDEKQENVRIRTGLVKEIRKLEKHIESLTPKKQSMLNSAVISRALKLAGAKDV